MKWIKRRIVDYYCPRCNSSLRGKLGFLFFTQDGRPVLPKMCGLCGAELDGVIDEEDEESEGL